MSADRVVVASANPKKAEELAAILAELWGGSVRVEPRPTWLPEVVEDADDFEGNARLKSVAVADATGSWSLADDSGLEVDALGGAPGVHSARFAGPAATDSENVALLLSEMVRVGAIDPARRGARFRCVIVLRRPDGSEVVAAGQVEGTVSLAPRGDGGFGYDPVFVPHEGDGRTFAEMEPSEKQAISHRGRALRALVAGLRGS